MSLTKLRIANCAGGLILAVLTCSPASAETVSLGCDASMSGPLHQPKTVTLTFVNRTGTDVIVAGAEPVTKTSIGPTVPPGQTSTFITGPGQPTMLMYIDTETARPRCIDTIRASMSDTVVIASTAGRLAPPGQESSFCEANPGICTIGVVLGAAAVAAFAGATQSSEGGASPSAPSAGSSAPESAASSNQGCYRYTCPELNSWLYTPMNDPNRFAVNDLNACLGQAGGISAFSTRKTREDACRDRYCTKTWDSQCRGG